MKTLFVITGLGMGGAENQVINLADELQSRGYQVTIAYILEPALVLPKNKEVTVVSLSGDKSIKGIFKAYRNLIKLIKKTQPDVVHSHMYHANLISRLSRPFAKIPKLVCTAHSTNEGGKLRMLSYRVTDCLGDVFTNVSQEAVLAFEDKKATPKNKMLPMHNGIDTNRFTLNLEKRQVLRKELNLENKKVFIAIGRFNEAKDYPNLLNTYKTLQNDFENTHLLIVGDGELRSDIEKLIKNLELTNKVTLLGIRKDVEDLLSASDIFVLSSAWEGFPLVVGEAMSSEKIIVSTDAGGTREFLINNDFLVPTKNSNELYKAMKQAYLLEDDEAKKIGSLGKERIIKKYSLKSIVDKWEEVYK